MDCGFYNKDKECNKGCRYWNTCTRNARERALRGLRQVTKVPARSVVKK